MNYTISEDLLNAVQTIEGSLSSSERNQAIQTIGLMKTEDASRTLVDIWYFTKWRETKKQIIQALGVCGTSRAIEFLLRISENQIDIPLASEAISALGNTNSMIAAEYLTNILTQTQHPLIKEALISLISLDEFSIEDQIEQILNQDIHSNLYQYAILAINGKSDIKNWKKLESIIKENWHHAPPPVLNAFLLAASNLGDQETLSILNSIDIKFRLFANSMKQNAIEAIQSRQKFQADEILLRVLDGVESGPQLFHLNHLKVWQPDQIWESYLALEKDFPLESQIAIRATINHPDKVKEDIDLFLPVIKELKDSTIVLFIRSLHNRGDKDFLKNLFHNTDRKNFYRITQITKDPSFFSILGNLVADEKLTTEDKISTINSIVSQCFMVSKGHNDFEKYGNLIFKHIDKEKDETVKARLYRALGQIQYCSAPFIQYLGQELKKGKVSKGSIYKTLQDIGNEDCENIICKRLSIIINKDEFLDELDLALNALSTFEKITKLDIFPQKIHPQWEEAALNILSKCQIKGTEEFILKNLNSPNYINKILAITASIHNGTAKIWNQLFEFLDHENKSISIRSMDALCQNSSASMHRKIFEWLDSNKQEEAYLHVFKKMRPELKGSYEGIKTRLNQLLSEKQHLLYSGEWKTALMEFQHNIASMSNNLQIQNKSVQKEIMGHNFDEELKKSLDHFDSYSETIKTVLRNAEITWHHPEIFNEVVDKSTIIIEFTKTVDILLQEKIGQFLFLDFNESLLTKLQNRLFQLNLLDTNIRSSERITLLQCHDVFSADEFPSHKLNLISQSIASGKIAHDQYHSLDGLRAWSLILLIYGRKFTYDKSAIAPLLPLSNSERVFINEIVLRLNQLQTIRNQAAHRGTFLESFEVEKVRQYSFELLNKLQKALW